MRMIPLTPQEARAYKERWRLVHEIELAELRQQSPDDKLRELAAIIAMGQALGLFERLNAEAQSGCENWFRLRRALGG